MRELGRVVKLQVQTGSLKHGPKREQYDPVHLIEVPELEITEWGVIGWQEGMTIQDVHHQDYMTEKGYTGSNLSFNFTSHYDQIRGRYGNHIWSGCGGDNIVFAAATPITLAELQGELILEGANGDCGRIIHVQAATPCLAYSRFVANQSGLNPAQLKETLQFLSQGQRGFYADWQGDPLRIRPGDRLLKS